VQTVVLRFRDFDEPTIERHQALIHQFTYVWWGWWKKENEPARRVELEHLRHLSRNAPASTPLNVGLFNRSNDSYYSAALAIAYSLMIR
jgi:hypothetical protein